MLENANIWALDFRLKTCSIVSVTLAGTGYKFVRCFFGSLCLNRANKAQA